MREKFRERKPKRSTKDGPGANEIYHKTYFLNWPILLWIPHAVGELIPGSKKDALFTNLKDKKEGLYFFTPGFFTGELEVLPFSKQTISTAEYNLKFIKRCAKDFSKKYSDSEAWEFNLRKRLYFLKKVISSYKNFHQQPPTSLFLEEVVYFATAPQEKPSQKICQKSLSTVETKPYAGIADIILCQRSLANSLPKEVRHLINTHPDVPASVFYRYLFKRKVPPQLLYAVFKLNKKIVLPVLEEFRLQGNNLTLETFKSLTNCLTELSHFSNEVELRTCLASDLVRKIYEMPSSYVKDYPFKRISPQFKENFIAATNEHIGNRGFKFHANQVTPLKSVSWFIGNPSKELKQELSFPGYFPSEKARENYLANFHNKCLTLLPQANFEWLLKTFMCYSHLTENNNNPQTAKSLLACMVQCREFCPPGPEGNDALMLSCVVFRILEECSEAEFNYLIELLPSQLTEILTYALNLSCNESYTVPSFNQLSKTLNRILPFIAKLKNFELDLSTLLKKERLSTLLYIVGDEDVSDLNWIARQDENWLDKAENNSSDWWSIFSANSEFRTLLLAWADKLRERGFMWKDISSYLYNIYYHYEDKKHKEFCQNFHLAERLYYLTEDIDALLTSKHDINYSYTFDDISCIIGYIDTIANGWQQADAYFDVLAEYFMEYANSNGQDSNLDLEENCHRIDWVSLIVTSPSELKQLLNTTPSSYSVNYSVTYQPMKWLKENEKGIFQFLVNFMIDEIAVRRVFNILKSLKVSLRLNTSKVKKDLGNWLNPTGESGTEILTFYRNLAENNNDLPRNIKRCIDMTTRLEQERSVLQSLNDKGILATKATLRLNKITELCADPERIARLQAEEMAKHLPDAIDNAKINSLEKISENICHSHWVSISGRMIKKWDDDWNNALQLCFSASYNKRILKRLMHNAAGDDFQWIYYHPDNINFLNKLDKSFQASEWLKPQTTKRIIEKQPFAIEVEHNLMKILHMGNYFGSCLSVGDFNDFSTIANAVEINKHVIWVKNKQGKVIGRKLIAFDQQLRLYGFNSYGAALGGSNENPWIKICLDLFCLDLAQKTGLSLSNERDEEKLTLFAHWYDDGIEFFDDWVMDLQKGLSLQEIAAKNDFDQDNQENFRAALWCKINVLDIDPRWQELHAFNKMLNKIV